MSGAATVQGWADAVRRFGTEWPAVGGRALADQVELSLRGDTGGDGSLRNYRGGAAAVGIEAVHAGADVVAAGSRGLWAILEDGTTAHGITRARGLLRTPYGPRRAVYVAGAPGRGTWSRGVANGMPDVARSADAAWTEVSRG